MVDGSAEVRLGEQNGNSEAIPGRVLLLIPETNHSPAAHHPHREHRLSQLLENCTLPCKSIRLLEPGAERTTLL